MQPDHVAASDGAKPAVRLEDWLATRAVSTDPPGARLAAAARDGLCGLPRPGSGRTLERWRALAAAAAHDLGFAKLYESHVDALAILAELGVSEPAAGTWAVWAAEPPQARLRLVRQGARWVLDGRKAWCSGAGAVDFGLVTAWDDDGAQRLAAVSMRGPGVRVTADGWHAVGMAATTSVDVVFGQAPAEPVGGAGDYTARGGFWHGGAGVAACWHGAAAALGRYLRDALAARDEPHAAAHLGALDVRLSASAALLREAAAWIDARPDADAMAWALRVRAGADAAAGDALAHALRALGAAPACRDAWFARMVADLPVFVRQCHAERDLAALARAGRTEQGAPWRL